MFKFICNNHIIKYHLDKVLIVLGIVLLIVIINIFLVKKELRNDK